MTRAQAPPAPERLTLDQYHDHPAWSASRLKYALTHTGRAYFAEYGDPDRERTPPTDAMRQGSLCDCLITQPGKASERYVIMPADAPRRPTALQIKTGADSRPGTKAHDTYLDAQDREAWWLGFDVSAAGREVIPSGWWHRAEQIREVLLADADIGPRLRDAMLTSQTPHLWTDANGLECRYLPDLETGAGGLWDLKKAASTAPRKMIAQSYQLAYDVQLAHYGVGFEDRYQAPATETGLIVYEWDSPHDYAMAPATPELLALGRERRAKALDLIQGWEERDVWPSHGTFPLTPPTWLNGSGEPEGLTPDSIVLF